MLFSIIFFCCMMIEEFGLKDIDVIIMFKGDYMFWNRKDREQKRLAKQKRKEQYDRVYKLHEEVDYEDIIDLIKLKKLRVTK